MADIDALAADLSDPDRDVVRRSLEGTADAAEHHADRLARAADTAAHDALAVPVPALWAQTWHCSFRPDQDAEPGRRGRSGLPRVRPERE